MKPSESLKSIKEVGGIFSEAASDIVKDAYCAGRLAIAGALERIDTSIANRINGPEDE